MFECKLAAEHEVSFVRDGHDASKACHISANKCARQLVGLSDRSLPNGGPCICALVCINDIVSVFDVEEFLSVQPYLNQRLVFFWEPEAINFLILPHKVCALDPEGKFLRRMTFDPHHGIVVHINPDSTFKQILINPLGYSVGDETAVRTYLLFAQKFQGIVVGGNSAVMMFFGGSGFDLATDQRIQRHMPDQSRA